MTPMGKGNSRHDRPNPYETVICHFCVFKAATYHLADRTPEGQWVASDYCEGCYEAKYLKPQPVDHGIPRPSFRLKRIMLLIALWALVNAAVAWVMRSTLITGRPEQIQLWTMQAFSGVNLIFGFFFAWFVLATWLRRTLWHRRTGGLLPMPEYQQPLKEERKAQNLRVLFSRSGLSFLSFSPGG